MEEAPILIYTANNTHITINNTMFSIGRSRSCDHIVEEMGISRFHCIIKKNGAKWTLFDRSTNGTRVNNELLRFNECKDLKSGDIIQIGDGSVQFIFQNPKDIIVLDDSNSNKTETNNIDNQKQEIIEINDSITTTSLIQDPLQIPVLPTIIATATIESDEQPQPPSSPISLFTNQNDEGMSMCSSPSEFCHWFNTNLNNAASGEEEQLLQEPVNVVATVTTITSSSSETTTTTTNINQSQSFDIMETELTCSICSELFIKAVTLNCSHTFCKHCIEQWKKNKAFCPICRTKIKSVASTLVLDNFINKIMETRPSDVKAQRAELIDQRNNIDGATTSASTTGATTTTTTVTIDLDNEDSDDNDDNDDDNEEEDSDDYNYDDEDDLYGDDDDEDDGDDYDDEDFDVPYAYDPEYNGIPGRYYGGYGHCYLCGERGHWANGCPRRTS